MDKETPENTEKGVAFNITTKENDSQTNDNNNDTNNSFNNTSTTISPMTNIVKNGNSNKPSNSVNSSLTNEQNISRNSTQIVRHSIIDDSMDVMSSLLQITKNYFNHLWTNIYELLGEFQNMFN